MNYDKIEEPMGVMSDEDEERAEADPRRVRSANDDGEPAYTVLGVYYDGDDAHQRYATVVYTHNGPQAAEELAQAACRSDNEAESDDDLIEIAGVLRGELEVIA